MLFTIKPWPEEDIGPHLPRKLRTAWAPALLSLTLISAFQKKLDLRYLYGLKGTGHAAELEAIVLVPGMWAMSHAL